MAQDAAGEFLNGKVSTSLEDAQTRLDGWVSEYNHERPHQSIGMGVPWDRFRLANPTRVEPAPVTEPDDPIVAGPTRRVDRQGSISFAATRYRAGAWLAGQDVTVVCDHGLVHLHHRGVLVATHARHHPIEKQAAGQRRRTRTTTKRPSASDASVTRKVDSSGSVSFARTSYRVGNTHRGRQVHVAVVGDTVEISIGTELIRSHPTRHDPTREHGAFANPGGRPHRSNAA